MFIPLYGKAEVSKRNIFLKDNKAEEIVSKLDFDFKKLKQSKYEKLIEIFELFIRELYIENL